MKKILLIYIVLILKCGIVDAQSKNILLEVIKKHDIDKIQTIINEGNLNLDSFRNCQDFFVIEFLIQKGIIRIDEINLLDGTSVFQQACECGNLEFIKKYFNYIDSSCIFYASKSENLSLLDYLIEKGYSLNLLDKEMKNPLMYAIEYSNINMVKHISKKGILISQKDMYGDYPIDYAIIKNDSIILNYLICLHEKELGFDLLSDRVHIENAIIGSNLNALNFFLNRFDKKNINDEDELGDTFLETAMKGALIGNAFNKADSSKSDIKTFECLIKNGININTIDSNGRTILYRLREDIPLSRYLINTELNINLLDKFNKSILFYMIKDILNNEQIFSNGYKVELIDSSELSLMMDLIIDLIKKKVTIDDSTKNSINYFINKIVDNNKTILLDILLSKNINCEIVKKELLSTYTYSYLQKNKPEIIQVLRKYNCLN